MDSRQIEAFINVIKLKSFSKAADALFLAQPTVSAQISSLENELGLKLIDRSGKEVVPTQAGKIFLEYACIISNVREQAVHELSEFSNKLKGRVEIAASTVPAQYLLPQYIMSFTKQYPNVNFTVKQLDSDQVIESVLDKSIEFGLVGTKIDHSKLEYKLIKEDKLVLITPNSSKYAEIDSNAISFDLLKNENFIIRESGSGTRQEFESALKKNSLSLKDINIIAQMNSTETIKQAVSLGLGVSIVSYLSVEDYVKFGMIKVFELEDFEMKREFYAVYQKNRPMSPLNEAFLKHIYGNCIITE